MLVIPVTRRARLQQTELLFVVWKQATVTDLKMAAAQHFLARCSQNSNRATEAGTCTGRLPGPV